VFYNTFPIGICFRHIKIKFLVLTHAHTLTHVCTLNRKYFKLNYNYFKVYNTRKSQITNRKLQTEFHLLVKFYYSQIFLTNLIRR